MTTTPKPISRQRRWQIRQKAEGRCIICGSSILVTRDRCQEHRDAFNARRRKPVQG